LWLSPEAFFNLSLSERAVVVLTKLSDGSFSVPRASELTLSRISSNVTNVRETFEESLLSLQSFFSQTKRRLCDGDLICVEVDGMFSSLYCPKMKKVLTINCRIEGEIPWEDKDRI
jgi:hypothetical protein